MRFDGSMKRNSNNPTCCPESKTAYLIKYHYDRLLTAAEHMGWYHTAKVMKGPMDLFNRVTKAVDTHKRKSGNKCPFKVRRVCACGTQILFAQQQNFQTFSACILSPSKKTQEIPRQFPKIPQTMMFSCMINQSPDLVSPNANIIS